MPDPLPPIETAVRGIIWPAVASLTGIRAVLSQLDQTQWWPPEALHRQQLQQLTHGVAHAWLTVPFYRERIAAVSWRPGQELTNEHWLQMPLMRRSELQQAGEAIRSSAMPPSHGATWQMLTSGSTGMPVQTVGTGLTQFFWRCLTVRDHLWHRRDFSQKLAVIRQFDRQEPLPVNGRRADNWGSATFGLTPTGPCVSLGIERTVAEQAGWLKRQAPGYLLTYPSNLLALAQWFLEQGERLPGLLEARTLGEVLEPRTRAVCRAAWGVPVVDQYSSQEVGYIALECPDCESYHVQAESLLVEVLDEAGRPCQPGQVGEVVVTTLHNFATPLFRYAIGDYAEVGGPCPCGRGLPVLTRIVGRQRNMLTLPTGERRWPAFADPDTYRAELGAFPPLQQFQIIQRTPDALEVQLVTPRPLRRDEEETVRKYLHRTLGYPFALSFQYVNEIPRSAGGKYEDFRSEL